MRHVARTAVIVDDHPLWLDALEALLARVEIAVAGRTTDATVARDLLWEHRPDLFVVDYASAAKDVSGRASAGNALPLLVQAQEANSRMKCVVLSNHDDARERERAFVSRATAYCVKQALPDDIAAAIRQIFHPSIYLAHSLAGQSTAAAVELEPIEDVSLTKREREILRLAAEGYSNTQLAKMLWVTEQTVKFHLSNIYRKLDVSNRTEASRWAQKRGLLTDPKSQPVAVG
jgi:DNA-binding NarL/FixJ family response regulator